MCVTLHLHFQVALQVARTTLLAAPPGVLFNCKSQQDLQLLFLWLASSAFISLTSSCKLGADTDGTSPCCFQSCKYSLYSHVVNQQFTGPALQSNTRSSLHWRRSALVFPPPGCTQTAPSRQHVVSCTTTPRPPEPSTAAKTKLRCPPPADPQIVVLGFLHTLPAAGSAPSPTLTPLGDQSSDDLLIHRRRMSIGASRSDTMLNFGENSGISHPSSFLHTEIYRGGVFYI